MLLWPLGLSAVGSKAANIYDEFGDLATTALPPRYRSNTRRAVKKFGNSAAKYNEGMSSGRL